MYKGAIAGSGNGDLSTRRRSLSPRTKQKTSIYAPFIHTTEPRHSRAPRSRVRLGDRTRTGCWGRRKWRLKTP